MSDGPHKLDQEMFLDRTSSKRMVRILRDAGFIFQTIYEVYPNKLHETTSDPEWIKLCGEKNWIVITGDKKIETVPENRQAVIDAKAKVFLLNDSNSKPEIWAAAILLGHYKMQELIDANSGPFYVTVQKRADKHVERIRRPRGYIEPESKMESVRSLQPEIQSTDPLLVTPEASTNGKNEELQQIPRDLFSNLS